jgi:adenylate cyclase
MDRTLPWRPTLRQLFAVSLVGLLAGLGLLFYLGVSGSESAILSSSDRYRTLASRFIASRVTDYLSQAPAAVAHFQDQAKYGVLNLKNRASVERGLLSLLLTNDNISEATLTYADTIGPANGGKAALDPTSAGQTAIIRDSTPGEFVRRLTWYDHGRFLASSDKVMPDASAQPMPTGMVPDPTQHLTFQTAYHEDYGHLIVTDLHWAQLDAGLPEAQRRVEVSVQETIEDAQGNFAGVLRVGLLTGQLNEAVEQHITGAHEPDQHLTFLCDNDGHLITGFGENHDRVTTMGDDLRVPLDGIPEPVLRALKLPVLRDVDEDHPASDSFTFHGKVYLCTFQGLPRTQGWIVGIVVPRDFYLGEILHIRDVIFWSSLALIAAIVVVGLLILRSVLRAQALVQRETTRMNRFVFAPTHHDSPLRDTQEVLAGLERAKTAMRAMSKYVPIDLVRRLYHEGEEPSLGACPSEISVMFTDIRDFTVIAETLPPARLAEVLGRYLHVMAEVIQCEKGTIDKYIGDAVMVFWNAPEPVAGHEVLACRAALRCVAALRELYARDDWGDAPKFETRFGLHRCQASVGHFGAPERLNYTAIGDGINLTSRLEALNKRYGTSIIVSETIHAAAREQFQFRLLDRVAVKGKMQGIAIYELIAEAAPGVARPAAVERYEAAFALYHAGDFVAAAAAFEALPDDPPSRALARRCRDLLDEPPESWTGVHVYHEK